MLTIALTALCCPAFVDWCTWWAQHCQPQRYTGSQSQMQAACTCRNDFGWRCFANTHM